MEYSRLHFHLMHLLFIQNIMYFMNIHWFSISKNVLALCSWLLYTWLNFRINFALQLHRETLNQFQATKKLLLILKGVKLQEGDESEVNKIYRNG